MGIEAWSTTANNNNSASPDGFPEGMAPSGVNNSARSVMASVRSWYEDAEWINLGDTPVYVSATQFKITATDVTATYSVGRRIKLIAPTPGTIYGEITVSSFSTDTTVTVVWDSGSLSSETLTSVSVGIIKGGTSSQSIDAAGIKNAATIDGTNTFASAQTFSAQINEAKGSDITSATTTDIGAATGNYLDITGNTTIAALGTVQAGTRRIVQFDGTPTLTYDTTALILPTSANIVAAAGDTAEFVSLGSGNWKCYNYQRADGTPLAAGSLATLTDTTIISPSDGDVARYNGVKWVNINTLQVLQRVRTANSTFVNTATTIPYDNTTPTNSEGAEYTQIATTITPVNSSSTLRFKGQFHVSNNSASGDFVIALFKDSEVSAQATFPSRVNAASTMEQITLDFTVASGGTSPQTWKIRYGPRPGAGTTYLNGLSSGAIFNGTMDSILEITEEL